MSKPISPQEAFDSINEPIPPELFESINDLLKRKATSADQSIHISFFEICKLLEQKTNGKYTREEVINREWDSRFESLYREKGWKVERKTKEGSNVTFVFSPRH